MRRVLLSLCILAVADAAKECELNSISDKMEFSSKLVFKCRPEKFPGQSMGVVVNGDLFTQVTCEERDGKKQWIGDGTVVIGLGTDSFTVGGCEEIDKKPCSVRSVDGPFPDATTKKLKCAANQAIQHNNRLFDELFCDEKINQWVAQADHIAGTAQPLTIKCVDAPACTVEPVDEAVDASGLLKCKDDVTAGTEKDKVIPRAIRHLGKYYKSLKCDAVASGKWTDAGGKEIGIANDKVLPMQCEAYCDISPGMGKAPAKDWDAAKGERTVECTDPFDGLLYGNKRIAKDKAVCDLDKWVNGDGEKIEKDTRSQLKVHCAKACNPTLHNSPTYTVEEKVVGTSKAYTCVAGSANEQRGIELNDGYIYSKLNCDKDKGWTDETGQQLFHMGTKHPLDAFAPVKLQCTPVNCTFTSSCDKVSKEVRNDYNCESVSRASIDRLACGDKKRLYDVADNKFYDRELRCRSAIKDNSIEWYMRPDNEITKRTMIGEHPNIVCLEYRCNKCAELPTATPEGTKSLLIPGTAGSCVLANCQYSLWSVKTANGAVQQYAGRVECSTNQSFEGNWMIDEKTPIVAGSCITEVSCMVAAKLNTKCDSTWRKFGCEEIAPSDSVNVSCPAGKNMYFKTDGKRPYFSDAGGKSELSCVKTEGLWRVTQGEILRGGIVICANENPAELKLPAPANQDSRFTQGQIKTAIIACGSIAGVVVVAVAVVVIYNEIRRRVYRGNEY